MSSRAHTHRHRHTHTHSWCCREAVTKTSLTLRYPLSEAYLLFVYVPLLFVLCLLLQSHSSPPFTVAFRPLTYSFATLSLSLSLLSLCCASSWGGIDDCLSAQATLKRSIAWWLWRLCRGSALCALPRWQSATENSVDAIPELCSTVGWSIRHRVKCTPRE